MPSDAIAIAGIITSPVVAGIVAIVVHHQRLKHERSESDLRQLRDILVACHHEAATFVAGLVNAEHRGSSADERRVARAEAERASDNYRGTAIMLRLILPDGHPLVAASDRVAVEMRAMLALFPGSDPRAWPASPSNAEFEGAMAGWFHEARALVGARMTD